MFPSLLRLPCLLHSQVMWQAFILPFKTPIKVILFIERHTLGVVKRLRAERRTAIPQTNHQEWKHGKQIKQTFMIYLIFVFTFISARKTILRTALFVLLCPFPPSPGLRTFPSWQVCDKRELSSTPSSGMLLFVVLRYVKLKSKLWKLLKQKLVAVNADEDYEGRQIKLTFP